MRRGRARSRPRGRWPTPARTSIWPTPTAPPRWCFAIINVHYDTAAVLIEAGADPNLADTTGMAALYAAVDMNTLSWMFGRPDPKLTDRLTGLDIVRHAARLRRRSERPAEGAAHAAASYRRRSVARRGRHAVHAGGEVGRSAGDAPAAEVRRRPEDHAEESHDGADAGGRLRLARRQRRDPDARSRHRSRTPSKP